MKTQVLILVAVLALAPVCLARPGVGEFFEKLFGVFHPEGINVTDVPDNATEPGEITTELEVLTETVSTEFDNETEVINAKLVGVKVESLVESDEVTTEATTVEDTTLEVEHSSSTASTTTTTVVYKLFHPNITTDSTSTTESTTVSTSTDSSTTVSSSSESSTSTTIAPTNATTVSTSTTADSSTVTTAASSPEVATSTISPTATNTTYETAVPNTTVFLVTPEGQSTTLATPLATPTTLVNNGLCKTTYDPATNLKITSCSASATSAKTERKRSVDSNVELLATW